MRKAYLLAIALLVFILSSCFAVAKVNATESNTIAPSDVSEVRYELPYPGLLPGNPLYPLKVVRDKIIGFLISDPLKKSEFNLLQADKRFNAGIYLMDKGETSLALPAISKAQNYFAEALENIEEAKRQKEATGAIEGKMKNALRKYEQELKIFIKDQKAIDDARGFETELKRVLGFQERLG